MLVLLFYCYSWNIHRNTRARTHIHTHISNNCYFMTAKAISLFVEHENVWSALSSFVAFPWGCARAFFFSCSLMFRLYMHASECVLRRSLFSCKFWFQAMCYILPGVDGFSKWICSGSPLFVAFFVPNFISICICMCYWSLPPLSLSVFCSANRTHSAFIGPFPAWTCSIVLVWRPVWLNIRNIIMRFDNKHLYN